MPKPPDFLENSSEDRSKNFPPGTTFDLHRHSVKPGLDFVIVLCTQSENYLPILMENNRMHQITLNKGGYWIFPTQHLRPQTTIDPNIR